MKRTCIAAIALVGTLAIAGSAAGHDLDHPAPNITTAIPGPAMTFNSSPLLAWELVATVATGNPHTDIDFFTQNGEIYMSAGTLAIGGNGGGQNIVRLTQNGRVTPTSVQYVSAHGSADCLSDPQAALALQHDVEAAPKGNVLLNTFVGRADTRDAQILLDATDARGRCHDAVNFGTSSSSPRGGLEIVDITNIANPKEIGLISHIGEAHTVNVDPKRPHIAFAVTSDGVSASCNPDDTSCTRSNGLALDGFEVVDLSSCMNFPALTSLDVKRLLCRPQVYRYRYPAATTALGHTQDGLSGCHELEIYPDDKLTCASISSSLLFDLSGAFDTKGTPSGADDTPRGTPLPCRVRDSMSPAQFTTGAKVTDCVVGENNQNLNLAGWNSIGAPSLEGVQFLGGAYHQGRGGPYDSTQDVDVSHEAELTGSGSFMLVTDERGGGVTPPGATCTPGTDNLDGNGGIHAYVVDRLLPSTPSGPNASAAPEAWASYAHTESGAKSIYRPDVHTGPEASLCTAHVFHQIPGQNRIFMGWYSQGTQVVDFVENPDTGTVEFFPTGYFIPASANTWTSAVFKYEQNADGTFTYYGATGDFSLGIAGRSAIDVWKVTLPAPRQLAPPPAAPKASLSTAAPATAKAGKTITYTISYGNTGTAAARDVTVVDTLPAGVAFSAASNGGTFQDGKVTWAIGTVAAGATGTRTVTVVVDKKTRSGTELVNRVDLTSGNTDAPPSATARTVVS